MIRLAAAMAAAVLLAGAAQAQTPAPPPPACATAEFRALDFWSGDWDLDFDTAPGVLGHASNHITRDEYGPCVIAEHFEQASAAYRGGSLSIYDPAAGAWRQTWVDNQGGVFVLTGGPVKGQPWVFELRTTEPVGPKKQIMRMIWQDVSADRLVWRWQAQQADGSWQDAWVLRYKRRSSPSPH
jgi:hypothetical protein